MWSFTVMLLVCVTLCRGRKNVLFLVSDDMRPQLGAYLGPDFPSSVHPIMHTPHLDKLAAKSLLLERAYVQQALCSPSRTSLLTSRRPDTTHVYKMGHYFRKVGGNFTTLPEYFKMNGYKSIGMGKIFHPGLSSHHDDPISWSVPYFHAKPNFESFQHSWIAVPDYKLNNTPLWDTQLADHAIKTLVNIADSARSGKTNFFLAVGFHRPHVPYVFPESLLKLYPEEDIRLPPNPYAPIDMPKMAWYDYIGLRKYKDIQDLHASGAINTTLPDKVVRTLRRAYYCAVTWADMQVGRVLDTLDRLGLANNTIVSFLGDHGYQLGEHGEWLKQTNFELAVHAPLMLRIPGMTDRGIRTLQLTEFVDIFPSLVEAAGLPPLPLCPENSTNVELCREGVSFIPLIKNRQMALRKAAFSQYPRGTEVMGYTLRTVLFRYTEWVKFNGNPNYKPDWSQLLGVELYDHRRDPDENYNRINDKDYESIKVQLSKELRAGWRHSIQTPKQHYT